MQKVSYLIPSYNHDKYIAETLNSIAADDYPSKEIVLIDDGSTDNTEDVIRKWIVTHPDIEISFLRRENRGITATLNELIQMATGEYLRLFSSDDLVIKGSTHTLAAYLHQRPDIFAVFSDVEVIDGDGKVIYDSALKMNGADIAAYIDPVSLSKEIITRWAVSGPAVLIRKSWYQRYGYYREDMRIDDWDLYLRLISRSALAYCNIKSAQYRRHDMNTCRTPIVSERIKNLKSQLLAVNRNLESFTGPQKTLLAAENALIKAKIEFLSRHYAKCAYEIAHYLSLRIKGRCEAFI